MHQLSVSKRVWTPTGVNIYKKAYEKNDDKLKEYIARTAFETYKQEPKSLQVEAVFHLARGRNTFLLAGTGFGKSQISEMYFKMIPRSKHATILVLNPLDSLGDNQVFEKEQAGFTAINLTKMNFNSKTADAIKSGFYNFIYLSPEIFLNSKSFDEVYFSTEFQNRLGMIVIDEAHMVYIWGLVESSTSKTTTSVHSRHEDYGLFRPCYGKLGPRLMFRNNTPLLLLSATCRPVAVEAIKKSLKLDDSNLEILRGELTRPEIRMIRIPMANSLVSTLDLIKVFPSSKDFCDDDLVPGLIYSGSRNRTLTAMEVVDLARETPGAAFKPFSSCIRRFHSCTGDQDKVDCVEDFSKGKFPLISCTMALGLGQNWKRVRMVVHMGRGDPAIICQMIGRCGRDGRGGLAIMFVEKTRRKGKNTVDQFTRGQFQNDQDRMDALAITPLCLRVAFSLDNLLGYVPLWDDDPAYLLEKAREIEVGMAKCLCSNCAVPEANKLMENLVFANKHNFDDILMGHFETTESRDISKKYPQKSATLRKRNPTSDERPRMDLFKSELIRDLHTHYENVISCGGPISAADVFGEKEAEAIILHLHHISSPQDVRFYIGGECFSGQLEWLYNRILDFKKQKGNPVSSTTKKDYLGPARLPKELMASKSARFISDNPSSGSGSDAPRALTKKALAAEASRQRSIEKKAQQQLKLSADLKRKEQVAQFLKEGLEQAKRSKIVRIEKERQQNDEEQHNHDDITSHPS